MELHETRKIKIGGFYMNSEYFQDEANQTIGQPLIGKEFEKRVINRRMVTARLTKKGKEKKQQFIEWFKNEFGVDIKLNWSKNCGCSMCPCSPGFEIKVEIPGGKHFFYSRDLRDNLRDRNCGKGSFWTVNDGFEDSRKRKPQLYLWKILENLKDLGKEDTNN